MIINAEAGIESSQGYTLAVDYWSLGVLIYEMLVGQTPFHDYSPRAIYRRILYGSVEFPWSIDPLAKDLIRKLLNRNPNGRLGSSGPGNLTLHRIEDIKRHRWFKGIDWEQMRQRKVPAPFVPRILHPGDTSNFLPYHRDVKSVEREIDFGDMFKDF